MESEIPIFDFKKRSLSFAKEINDYVRKLPADIPNRENGKQLVRAAGSVGANYIEADDCLGSRDKIMRLRISRKEAREALFWIDLTEPHERFINDKTSLMREADELLRILSAILNKMSK
jgi:four helix bundle protein